MIRLLLLGWAALAVLMAVLWLRQLRTRNATSVDAAWSVGMGILAVTFALLADSALARRLLVGGLAAIWAARLAWHLISDRVLGRPEDGRYRALRETWGRRAPLYFFIFYQGQAIVATLFAVPILAAMQGGALDAWAAAGALIWLVAVLGETIADRQLSRFRANPANRGRSARAGLWRYSRHPNYFFEWTHWFSYVLIGHGVWPTWIGPVVMLLFLFRLTGIPFTERQAVKSRGDDYRAYQRETSVFFPWFPLSRRERGPGGEAREAKRAARGMKRVLQSPMSVALDLAERGLLPEPLVRWGIRLLLAQRLRQISRPDPTLEAELTRGPVALVPEAANQQHYELPASFFQLVLGSHLKYSSAFWNEEIASLDEAELVMLEVVGSRAQLADGQRVLELGCGWGSLTLWMAQRYPNSRIVAVSNSAAQREFITARAPTNVRVITADMNEFRPEERFDRVVSIEMFEHMRNWRELIQRIAAWLEPGGKLFVHVFCHRHHAYRFETDGAGNWLGRYFFTGGLMPSLDLVPRLQAPLVLEKTWEVDGTHYARTAEAWATNLRRRKAEAIAALTPAYGADAPQWVERWWLFFIACAELFGYRHGREWLVGHYRLRKP